MPYYIDDVESGLWIEKDVPALPSFLRIVERPDGSREIFSHSGEKVGFSFALPWREDDPLRMLYFPC